MDRVRHVKSGPGGGSRSLTPSKRAGNTGKRRHLDEANVSTESNPSKAWPWVSRSDEFAWWSGNLEAPSSERAKAPRGHDAVEVAMSPRTGRFQRADRLLRSKDFQHASQRGRRIASRQFVILMAPSQKKAVVEETRLGVTVSRRVGNAVLRNRIKRAVREWFRHSRGNLERRVDMIVIARAAAKELSASEVGAVLDAMVVASERTEE